MIDKIKAEADAIPCGKDEKIKALEALLKLALKERDEVMAYAERLRGALNVLIWQTEQVNGWEQFPSAWIDTAQSFADEQPPAALAALKAEWQAVGAMSAWLALKRMGMAQAGSKNVIQSLVLKLRQRAQEAGDE